MPLLPVILSTALGIALLLLHHHRRPLTRDRTLLATLCDIPSNIASDSHRGRRLAPILFHLAIAAGCLAPLAPAFLTLILAFTPPPTVPDSDARLILAIAGPTLFLLAALCTLVILFSGLVIGFGSSGPGPWTHAGHFTVWYLFSVAASATLAALVPSTFADIFRFAAP